MNLVDSFLENTNPSDGIYVRGLGQYVVKLWHKFGIARLRILLNASSAEIFSWRMQGIPLKRAIQLDGLYFNHFGKHMPYRSACFGAVKSHHNVKLPKTLTNELCYAIGYLFADGTIPKDLKKQTYRVEFDDVSKEFLSMIANIIKKIFNLNKFELTKDKLHNCYCLRFNSKILALFLIRLFKIPAGKKKWKSRIPSLIKNSDFLKDFITGFVDGEGHVYFSPRLGYRITIVQNDNEWFVTQLKNALRKFGIDSVIIKGKRIEIRRKDNVINFLSTFNLQHPDKTSRISLLLNGKRTTKNSRISPIKKEILNALAVPKRTVDLSRKFKIQRKTAWWHLKELELAGFVVGKRNKNQAITWQANNPICQ